jgi:tetratricopeptide (TPR) repeat protein
MPGEERPMATKDAQKQFDVFISYSHKDAEWVRQWLIARLKQEGITVCVDNESFDPGIPALVNMENAVAASRRTLLVLTRAWVESEWTRFESFLIQHDDPTGMRQRTLPLLLEPCDAPKRIKTLTHLDFTGAADMDQEFARLLDAIRGIRRLSDPGGEKPVTQPDGKREANHARINPAVPRSPAVGFVARHDKDGSEIVARLHNELAPEKNQLIVLWGDGGVGKTTIAAEVVRRMSGLFAGRIVWTKAEGRQDYSLSTLLDEIATQLGNAEVRKLPLEPKKEEVRSLIASLDGAVLVVLDNFETIAPAEQKQCAEWLMHHAPCPALITTRERVNGPRNLSIDVMSSAEAHEYLDKLIAETASSRTFAGIDRDRIIQAADANPLVMQWVIGQIELAQHPNDVLDDLAQGGGDAAERVFDRSFNLPQLGDDGRDALLALSLFVPSAARAALAEVAGFDNNIRRLREAVKHLAALRLVETTEASERLILRGLTRSLAKARLSNDARAGEFRRRFLACYVRYAEAHSQTTPEDFDALKAERDNVLGAMDEAFQIKDWPSVQQIMTAIGKAWGGFLSMQGYWDEAIQRNEQARHAAQVMNDEHAVAVISVRIASMFYKRGEFDKAHHLHQQALDIFKKLKSEGNIAVTLHELAMLAQDQGEIEEARRLYNDSLEIKKQLGNQSGIAITLHELGRLAQNQGEIEEARRFYHDSLAIKKQLSDQSGIASSLHQLGVLAQDQGEIEEARRLYNDSLEIKKRIGNQSGIASSLHQLGRIAEIESKYAEAAQLFDQAFCIWERLKSPDAAIARRSLERVQGKS